MSHRVNIESFQGPFDLLLYLVNRQKVDIGAISITQIIDQYLAEVATMDDLDLDVASDFLLVASTLLKIKAESLVNDDVAVDDDVADLEPSEARDILVDRLITYKQFKNAALALAERADEEQKRHARPFGPDPDLMDVAPDFLADVTLDDIGMLAVAVLSRKPTQLLDSEHIAAKHLPVEAYMRSIHERIRQGSVKRFDDLIDETTPTPVVVVTFLAVLELYKRAMIKVKQKKLFGTIEFGYIEGSEDIEIGDVDSDTGVAESVSG